MSYAQNAANKRMGYGISLNTSWKQFVVGRAYTRIKKVIGARAEDLGWSLKYATLEQKVEAWEAWEFYFLAEFLGC